MEKLWKNYVKIVEKLCKNSKCKYYKKNNKK